MVRIGASIPAQRCLPKSRGDRKEAHSRPPSELEAGGPSPACLPGCGAQGAAGCAWLRRCASETLLRWEDKRGGGGVWGAEAAAL